MRRIPRMLALLLLCSTPALAQSHGKAWENVVIDNKTGYWRVFQYWKTPRLLAKNGEFKPLREMRDERRHKKQADRKILAVRETKKPPENWTAPEFDHTAWSRQHGTYGAGRSDDRTTIYGAGNPTELAFIGLRGEFEVKDPKAVKDLLVTLEYHGGVVVYINGVEIRRHHLPDGELEPDTLAEAYPMGAYIKPEFDTCEAIRLRKATVRIKPGMVKKGINTVAIGVYRAPVRDVLDQTPVRHRVRYPIWAHAYVRRAMLHSGWGLTPKSAVCSVDEPEKAKREPGEDILNTKLSYWRTFTRWKTVELIDDAGRLQPLKQRPTRRRKPEDCKPLPVYATPAAPDEWATPGFDDSEWARARGRLGPNWRYGSTVWTPGNPAALSVVYARGKFRVTDPAACKGLRVLVTYHGGLVVTVNGAELARQDLPDDELTPDTLAAAYGRPAYVKPTGHLIHLRDAGKFRDHIEQHRIRTLEAEIPPGMLRKGTNVVGLEVHRAPANVLLITGKYQYRTFRGNPGPWPHAGVRSARVLTTKDETPAGSVAANLGRPEGVQVWNSRSVRRILRNDYGNPCEAPHAIRMVGCRNGAFDGHVAFGATETIEELEATITDLKTDGGTIPASKVEVSYPGADGESYAWGKSGECVTLFPDPPKMLEPTRKYRGVVQPVWLKVRVARDAKPGTYKGTLTIRYKKGIRGINLKPGPPIEIPVALTVHDWALPDPPDFVTFMDYIQSPESVAMKFDVPQWSDEHWKWMASSFRLLGEIGNDAVYLPLITRTHFGNSESILRYVKQPGGGHKPDFRLVDRYLDLAETYQGKPECIILYLWERYTCLSRRHKKASKMKPLVTELDPKTGEIKEVAVPRFCTPQGKKYWTPILRAVQEHIAKRGEADALMIGITADWSIPPPKAAKFFDDILPGIRWVDQSHGALTGVRVDGKKRVPIGYLTTVWNARGPGDPRYGKRTYGWRRKTRYCQFARDLRRDHLPLYVYRTMPEWNITGGQRGMGRFGADFWNVFKRDEKVVKDRRHSAGATLIHRYPDYSPWAQLVVRTSFLGWSEDGAIPSVHFEAMREGVQNCEARIAIEKALLDGAKRAKLGDELAEEAQAMLDERTWVMAHRQRGAAWFFDAGFTERQHELYATAARVAKALAQ